MQKMSIELEKVNQQLSQLKCKKASTETENQSANSSSAGTSEIGQDDSPFAHVPSPLSADPLELLPLENSKRPENIYKVFRQSCSFLKTPQASAFRKTEAGQRTSAMHAAVDETPNISRRLQKQLADLFDEWFIECLFLCPQFFMVHNSKNKFRFLYRGSFVCVLLPTDGDVLSLFLTEVNKHCCEEWKQFYKLVITAKSKFLDRQWQILKLRVVVAIAVQITIQCQCRTKKETVEKMRCPAPIMALPIK